MFELIALICAIAMYFLPAIIAHHRHHVSSGAIFLINLLFGWSIIGWIICFAWACSGNTRPQVVILPTALMPVVADSGSQNFVLCRS